MAGTKRPATVLAASAAVSLFLAAAPQQVIKEPDPSYREDAPWNRRHPGVDTDVLLYINHWRNSPPREGHGGLLERDILSRGDPFKPERKGGVLRFLKTYARAELAARSTTRQYSDLFEQVFFYVMSGRGAITVNKTAVQMDEGTAVVVPAAMSYRLDNPGDEPLELFLAAEEVPAAFASNKHISVGRFSQTVPILGAHWAHIGRPFQYDREPKFANPMGFIVVAIDDFDIAQPHTHPASAEEIWLQLKGHSLLLFGNRLLRQEPGEAFLVPPNSRVPHSSINTGDEPQLWLFFGCRKGE